MVARWYSRMRSSETQISAYRKQALKFTGRLRRGAHLLEVAPGPGYLAIEMARLGRFKVTGLDISPSFVEIASENARQSAVSVEFQQGDAASMPFDAESFDLVVCQAAFKDFGQPGRALDEMHRVLRNGGAAVIQDMSGDASDRDIEQEVNRMELGRLRAFMTKWSLKGVRRRAYTRAQFERLAAESAFRTCDIQTEGLGIEVRLKKRVAS
jgi:ubiquinone/menaquinone biosynthesis C-methylase UbiE